LDEFTALGRIPIIAEAISYLPGYNVRVVLVIQTPAQLREIYGAHNAETMLKSLAARIVFAPKDYPDAREISDELGYTTVKVKTVSSPQFSLSDTKGRRSRTQSTTEQRRALLLPQEVKELGTDHEIIFYEGMRPIRCRKIRYFEDPRFKARLFPPPARPPAAPLSNYPVTPSTAPAAASAASDLGGPVTREATLDDIHRIDSLTLEDFATDFSQVKLPESGPLTDEDMTGAVASFISTLRER